MKNLTFTSVVGCALLLAAATLGHAQIIISVNFQGNDTATLASGDVTGAPGSAVGNWNNLAGASGSSISLNNSNGTDSGVTLTAFSAGPFGASGPNTDNSTPQAVLFGGGLDVNYGSATFTVSGLSQFSSYSLIAYYTGYTTFADTRDADITASGSTQTFYISGIDSVNTDYTQSNSTTPGTYSSGNYVVFNGLTASSESVAMENSNNDMVLVGFQVIGTPAASTPEPSAWAMMVAGLGLLAGLLRLRRQNV